MKSTVFFDEGYIAFIEGLDIFDCPYKPDSEEGKQWLKGYNEAMDADADAWFE